MLSVRFLRASICFFALYILLVQSYGAVLRTAHSMQNQWDPEGISKGHCKKHMITLGQKALGRREQGVLERGVGKTLTFYQCETRDYIKDP